MELAFPSTGVEPSLHDETVRKAFRMRLLFVCARNRLRSPTAERVFAAVPGIEADSAGISPDAENPVTPESIQ